MFEENKYYRAIGQSNSTAYKYIKETNSCYIFEYIDFVEWNPFCKDIVKLSKQNDYILFDFFVEVEELVTAFVHFENIEYNDFCEFSKRLAKENTKQELENKYFGLNSKTFNYSKVVNKPSKKQTTNKGNSQQRAHSKNNLTCNIENKRFLLNALKIHFYFPDECKNN